MRKIGSITPLWGQEMWIHPHFTLLDSLDKNVVMLQNGPLGDYELQHGYTLAEDESESILRQDFPKVEVHRSSFVGRREFSCDLFNECLPFVQDMDIVLKLDPDMLFTKNDWQRLITLIQTTDADCYSMDYAKNSINYYITGDFAHGARDAQELDIIAFNPKKQLQSVLSYEAENPMVIDLPDWMCHHFRGWNKPKSVAEGWEHSPSGALVRSQGDWVLCPEEVRALLS